MRWICADAILGRRAIENLLDNARKYSPEGSPVTAEVTDEAGSFRVAVTDRGCGIDPGDLPRIFTPFFRADRSRARATGGVGVGLALAKRVVEAHGGQIAAVSHGDSFAAATPGPLRDGVTSRKLGMPPGLQRWRDGCTVSEPSPRRSDHAP